jgi:hypothetical protein
MLAASSPTDVWAVGRRVRQPVSHPLIAHWNGGHWRTVLKLDVVGRLDDIDARAPDDAWAVGSGYVYDPVKYVIWHSLVLRWNGKTWRRMPAPPPAEGPRQQVGELYNVEAVGPGRAWAVGLGKPIYEWNGERWRPQRGNPREFVRFGLDDIDVRTPTDAWATAGSDLFHWDGKRWARTTWRRRKGAVLEGVAAVSAREAWATGGFSLNTPPPGAFALRWNGGAWRKVPLRRGAASFEVDAHSESDTWALAAYPDNRPWILRWDGDSWRDVVRGPAYVTSAYQYGGGVGGLDVVARDDLWIRYGESGIARLSC